MMINKLKKRNKNLKTKITDGLESQYIEQYKIYFENAINKCNYEEYPNKTDSGECILLGVSNPNEKKDGDEKWVTTLPNCNLKVGNGLTLNFAEDYTEHWLVIGEEHLAIKSHKKFQLVPLYKKGELIKANSDDNVELFTRLVNNNANILKKNIYTSTDFIVESGDYIKYDDNRYFLVNQVEENDLVPFSSCFFCNQTINAKGFPYPMPCYADDSSYGQKGVIDTNYNTSIDGQIMLKTQDNKYTKAIPLGYRLMFDNDKNQVYTVTKNETVTTKNVRRIMIKKAETTSGTTAIDERDDIANNIAWNDKVLDFGDEPTPPPTPTTDYHLTATKNYWHNKYTPEGYDISISKRGITKIYVVDKDDNDVPSEVWTITHNIDEVNAKQKFIDIISQGNNFIEIKNILGKASTDLNITFEKDGISLPCKIKIG